MAQFPEKREQIRFKSFPSWIARHLVIFYTSSTQLLTWIIWVQYTMHLYHGLWHWKAKISCASHAFETKCPIISKHSYREQKESNTWVGGDWACGELRDSRDVPLQCRTQWREIDIQWWDGLSVMGWTFNDGMDVQWWWSFNDGMDIQWWDVHSVMGWAFSDGMDIQWWYEHSMMGWTDGMEEEIVAFLHCI